jgi:hypothetical protein
MLDIQQPPAEYLPYDGPLVEVLRPLWQVQALCRDLGVKDAGTIYGCQLWPFGGCLIIIADLPERKQIEEHEKAHCNGWRHE